MGGVGREIDAVVGGWVRTDHITPNSGLSLRPTLPSSMTQRVRNGVNGAKRRKKAVILWMGQLCQASHLEMRGKHKKLYGPAGGMWKGL